MEILLGNAYQKGAIKPRWSECDNLKLDNDFINFREALYGGMETILRNR